MKVEIDQFKTLNQISDVQWKLISILRITKSSKICDIVEECVQELYKIRDTLLGFEK